MGTVPNNTLEFTSDQETVLAGLASNMKLVAIALLVLAPLRLVFGGLDVAGLGLGATARNGATSLVEGVLTGLLGMVMLKGSADVRFAVDTKGYDKEHLLIAVESLTVFYRVLVGLGVVVLLISA